MSHFSNALQRLMDERGWNQPDVVNKSRGTVSQSQVSRYLSGSLPDRDSIDKIMLTFDTDKEHWDLLSAWLKDLTPDRFRTDLMIVPHHPTSHFVEKPPDDLGERIDALPARTRKVLERLIAAMERRPDATTRLVEGMLDLTEPPKKGS